MDDLIIYAHPNTKGHCSEILKLVKKKLKKYELIDLYKMNYDPVLHENELYTTGNKKITKQNKKFQDQIKKADRLIFIYPIWWGGMPAILKGWFDKVFVSGFAFNYEKKIPFGKFHGKKAIVFLTTASPKLFTWLLSKNRYLKNIKNEILGFCGIKTKVYEIDWALELDSKQKKKIKKTVNKALK